MIYTVQFECIPNKDKTLTDAWLEVQVYSDGSMELVEFETKTFNSVEEMISQELLSYGDINSERANELFEEAKHLIETEGCTFFNNLIYKDMGGSFD